MRGRAALVAVVATLCTSALGLGLGAVPAAAQAAPLAPPPVPAAGAYLGASASVHNGETRTQAIERTEAQIGRRLDIDHQFYRWDQNMVGGTQQADAAAGRYPFVSWKPMTSGGQVITWPAIAAGEQDAHIRSVARSMRDFGHPMFAVFHHEPYDESLEGWGTPADYIAAYRRVVTLAREEGATNVAWVMVLTSWDYHQGRGDVFYPGPDVIDWIAADPYNYFPRDGDWDSLHDVAAAFYEWGSTTGKPLMLAEWGSAEDPGTPGRKAQWLDEATATLAGWPNVRAAVYFNNLHTYDWRIDTSPSALDAFRRLAHHPHFQPSTTPPPPPPPPLPALDCDAADEAFDDVGPEHPHLLAIACAAAYGLLDDVVGGFEPERPVTRGELAGMIAAALGTAGVQRAPGASVFTDVAGHPHEDDIRWLSDLGVLRGYRDDSFGPDDLVTRSQLASIVVRAHDVVAPALPPGPPVAFGDIAGSVHADAIVRAVAAGILKGTTRSTFTPAGDASRAQVAAILTRLLQRFVADGVDVRRPA